VVCLDCFDYGRCIGGRAGRQPEPHLYRAVIGKFGGGRPGGDAYGRLRALWRARSQKSANCGASLPARRRSTTTSRTADRGSALCALPAAGSDGSIRIMNAAPAARRATTSSALRSRRGRSARRVCPCAQRWWPRPPRLHLQRHAYGCGRGTKAIPPLRAGTHHSGSPSRRDDARVARRRIGHTRHAGDGPI